VRREPALGGVTLAILFLGAVLLGDELRHQGHDHVVSGRDDGRRQHGMIEIGLAVRALARLAVLTTELLRAEVFGSVERDQRATAEALEIFHAAPLAKRRNHLIE
jgi:hypothetical protein